MMASLSLLLETLPISSLPKPKLTSLFTDLPLDLFLHIAEAIDNNTTLAALIGTCRDFYVLGQPILFRRNDISPGVDDHYVLYAYRAANYTAATGILKRTLVPRVRREDGRSHLIFDALYIAISAHTATDVWKDWYRDKLNVIKALAKRMGPDIDKRIPGTESTVLHLVSKGRFSHAVRILIDAGADFELKDKLGFTLQPPRPRLPRV
ncbi:hypothetical protein B0T25DRAFT_605234 [Lasiosphaeria hispida]|uniref:Uncharacterized protein n=1 Tax=Lasiosphaeria hispida TaxID=260671 RepID=A0AAJ0HN38_9PEZI|nr:hypothetical protein B0T25DRAFT_605234 [Lasiosphaeria hispida]